MLWRIIRLLAWWIVKIRVVLMIRILEVQDLGSLNFAHESQISGTGGWNLD